MVFVSKWHYRRQLLGLPQKGQWFNWAIGQSSFVVTFIVREFGLVHGGNIAHFSSPVNSITGGNIIWEQKRAFPCVDMPLEHLF
jgi:hypothetical protein